MPHKILIINSFGPMGSTLLSGLCEKLGYGNVPVRKTGLHRYLMGEEDLNSGYMQKRLRTLLEDHSKKAFFGGVSVLDRDNQAPKALASIESVEEDLRALEAQRFESVQDLYFACRALYDRAVIYKTPSNDPHWQIELTTDIHRYDPQKIYEAYKHHFDHITMVHLTRDFKGWINSLASQGFSQPTWKNRIKFFPHMRYRDFKLYEDKVAQIPGLTVPFDEMFETPIEELFAKLADFSETPRPGDINLRTERYDLYGKFHPYNSAFKKFDDSIEFLKKDTLEKYGQWAQDQSFLTRKTVQLKSWLLYLKDMVIFRWKKFRGYQ